MNFIQQSKQLLCQTTIALAIAGLQANAETLEIHVTRNDGKEYILPVDRDESSLYFYNFDLTSLILPEGLTNLRELKIYNGPEYLTVSVHYNMGAFVINLGDNLTQEITPAKSLAQPKIPGYIATDDGITFNRVVFEHVVIEIYGNPIQITRREDGIEIVWYWVHGTLQFPSTINGPWKNVHTSDFGKILRRARGLFQFSPSAEFSRLKLQLSSSFIRVLRPISHRFSKHKKVTEDGTSKQARPPQPDPLATVTDSSFPELISSTNSQNSINTAFLASSTF